jgi:hypothetical protein
VVKDPTQPGPGLVTEVKYSSLTILHQIYSVTGGFYISHRFRRERVRNIEGFQQGGALERLDQFDLAKEKEIWEFGYWVILVEAIAPFLAHPGGVLVEY